MNEDELKKLWQQQPLRDPALAPAQVISAMHSKTTQLRRTLLVRDVTELVACVIVAVIFGIYYFTNREPIARLGDLIVIGSAIFIAGKLIHSPPDHPTGATWRHRRRNAAGGTEFGAHSVGLIGIGAALVFAPADRR